MSIQPRPPRPEWVVQAIDVINATTEQIIEAQERVRGLALRLVAHGVSSPNVLTDLTEADHDLEHAYGHVVGVRRAMRMAWPSEEVSDG